MAQSMQTNHSSNRTVGAQVAEKAGELADKASQQIDRVVAGAESTARSVGEQGREVGERVQEVAGNIKTAVDRSVTEQPMTTLAVAAAIGFVIGALWKS